MHIRGRVWVLIFGCEWRTSYTRVYLSFRCRARWRSSFVALFSGNESNKPLLVFPLRVEIEAPVSRLHPTPIRNEWLFWCLVCSRSFSQPAQKEIHETILDQVSSRWSKLLVIQIRLGRCRLQRFFHAPPWSSASLLGFCNGGNTFPWRLGNCRWMFEVLAC